MTDYIARRIGEPIEIDGNIEKPVWKNASWSRRFVDMTTGVSRVESDNGKVQGLFNQASGPGCGPVPPAGAPAPATPGTGNPSKQK